MESLSKLRGTAFLGVLLWGMPARADGPRDAEVIDPEEVVDADDETGAYSSGSWDGDHPSSLCVVQAGSEVRRLFYIPYVSHEIWRPCHGPDRRTMTYAQFYAAVERPDLNARQARRDTLKLTMFISQIALFVGGTVVTAVGIGESEIPLVVTGLSLIGGTFVLNVTDDFIPSLAVSYDEAQKAAAGFRPVREVDSAALPVRFVIFQGAF